MSDVVARIAEALVAHEGPIFMDGIGTFQCECGFDCNEGVTLPPEELWATKNWAAHVAGVVAEALHPTITAVEGLIDLPRHSLVRDYQGEYWDKLGQMGRWDNLSTDGGGGLKQPTAIPLPATVLYTPEGQE